MKQAILITLILVVSFNLCAHEHGHGVPSKTWELEKGGNVFLADFIKEKDGVVYLSDEDHSILEFRIERFSKRDQQYILGKSTWIKSANTNNGLAHFYSPGFTKWFIIVGLFTVLFSVFRFVRRGNSFQLMYGILGLALVIVGCENTSSSSQKGSAVLSTRVPMNNVDSLNAVFGVFDDVNTRYDSKYYYVESDGIPEHEMMSGITNWQQQVPIPHDYSGENSWAIPMQPQLSANPLSTTNNFMKGAIAIASNGIPIFNPLNNRGEDANAIGELDRWGGHCGRADDYHYHLPPTHLQAQVGEGKPIAYALDGFPVYGETTEVLDEYLGRFNPDSSYQYHAVKYYPYLIAGMRGKVEFNPRTKAPENEIMPQAKTRGVRPDLRPLRGAEITGFRIIQSNQYTLTYTLDGEAFVINYGWDEKGMYTFEFVNPDGTSNESSYQR
jgi:hypothetical protein